jgi:trehalose 6-phosphate phosphatase
VRNLWSPVGLRALRQACDGPLLVGFDFDGTLAPIVRQRDTARMRRTTRTRLLRLARAAPCAVVSGRVLADLKPRVRGIPLAAVIGSHGIEPYFRSAPFAIRARSWHSLVGAELQAISEVDVERKPFGMAVHFRRASDRARAKKDIRKVLARLEGAKVMWGHAVADVTPLGAPAKDQGVERARKALRLRHVLYIGDDTTDEDVFRYGRSREWLTIRVGQRRASAARYYIPDQTHIDRLLDLLYELHTHAARA